MKGASNQMGNAYAKAGVDVEAGYEVVDRIKKTCEENRKNRCDGCIRRLWWLL